jgi:hypothetical protein
MTRRKSKRELERTVEQLGPGGSGVPTVDLAQLIAADEIEEVDDKPDLLRLDGHLYRTRSSPRLDDLLHEVQEDAR